MFSETELAANTIKYFLYPKKLWRLQVCIFSAGDTKVAFTLMPLVGRGSTVSLCLSSKNVLDTPEMFSPFIASPALLVCAGSLIFRVC